MSKEYIEREQAIRKIKWASCEEEAVMGVRRIPAADVVEVVRCRDCKYRSPKYDEPDEYYSCELKLLAIDLNGFCSEGKRREK